MKGIASFRSRVTDWNDRSTAATSDGAKRQDAWWTVLTCDPIAVPASRWLVPVRLITPNGITIISIILGFVSSYLFATGHLVFGALVSQVSFVLDCMDGKLARLRRTSSKIGRWLDALGDRLTVTSRLGGLAWYAWHANSSWWVMGLLVLYLVLFVLQDLVSVSLPKREVPPATSMTRYQAFCLRYRLFFRPITQVEQAYGVLFFIGPLTGYMAAALTCANLMAIINTYLIVRERTA